MQESLSAGAGGSAGGEDVIVIKIVEVAADGIVSGFENSYIKSFKPYWNEDGFGEGKLSVTKDRAEALQFKDIKEAFDFWNQQSPTVPMRPDGKPNKPLTAFTVLFDKA